jgi:hypothetical protein
MVGGTIPNGIVNHLSDRTNNGCRLRDPTLVTQGRHQLSFYI